MTINLNKQDLSTLGKANRAGQLAGIYSVCSANSFVLKACLHHAFLGGWPLIVESTCNQVNQFGGYTGMTPEQFTKELYDLAKQMGFPPEQLILGGDHLGPNPWRHESTTVAMSKARDLVMAYVRAGYEKIHLDASMSLGDDAPDRPLSHELIASRTADLAVAAEAAYRIYQKGPPPLYVIGTEVPPPGGAQDKEDSLSISDPAGVAATIATTKEAFAERGLVDAWERVIAVVVQPGVEFGDDILFEYERGAAQQLSDFIKMQPMPLVYEAHSTDYQTAQTLRQLVEDHFAILKVGPALTFAFREAVFALEMIEQELFASGQLNTTSNLRSVIEETMLREPDHWQKYYSGSSDTQRFKRHFSLSDRIRYYWPTATVEAALGRLLCNLREVPPPPALVSQFMPEQHQKIRKRKLSNEPQSLIIDHIGSVLIDYSYACGHIDDIQHT